MTSVLYILYNADASVMGKINYGYRKLIAAKGKPACAACDITHGGLRLDETKGWKAIKEQINQEGIEIKQLHRDELNDELKSQAKGARVGLEVLVIGVKNSNNDWIKSLITVSETFSFHKSPESFITSKILAVRKKNPLLAEYRTPVRAKVLNRDVAVISSYKHVAQILEAPAISLRASAESAYEDLMAPFFPPPNLLLSDLPEHTAMKEHWQTRMAGLSGALRSVIVDITRKHFQETLHEESVDLYECMKSLSWKLLLRIFIAGADGCKVTSAELLKYENLQEDLLRGQFSLFPVSVTTSLWQSPRAKGLAARKELQALFKTHVERSMTGCPFAMRDADEKADVANHLLLFTSSLAAKALASSLTALLLNIYVFPYHQPNGEKSSLAREIVCLQDESQRDALIRSIMLETERLSPPVVGIMRRTKEDVILESLQGKGTPTLVPKDWDLWMYFVGAARDPAVFGKTADSFVPRRYYDLAPGPSETKEGFAFGTGPKTCLGRDMMRGVASLVVKSCLGIPTDGSNSNRGVRLETNADDIPTGVQAYLGWQQDVEPMVWAKDMKQLPTQRPKKAVTVKFTSSPL
ncbi:MAG: hypothetical protein Q9225_006771 [Loekoesia sp. 1 TL-2023]